MLLKSQAFALSAGLPAQLQVQVSLPVTEGAAAQTADLDALIAALGKRDAELATAIADLSRQLLSGEGYAFLPPTGTVSPTTAISDVLSLAIARNYPQLFSLGDLAQLTEAVPTDNPLAASATDKSKSLLQLSGLETLPDYSTAAEPVTQSIDKLQQEISAMQAQLEQQQSTKQQLTQARDLTLSTYTTLASKQAEVAIATGIMGSVVRFASPALPPVNRVSSRTTPVLIAGLVGLLLGVIAAYVVEFLLAGGPPPQALAGNPLAPWNRLWRWVLG